MYYLCSGDRLSQNQTLSHLVYCMYSTLQNSCLRVYREVWCKASKFTKPRFKFRTETTKLQVFSTTAICNIETFSSFVLYFVMVIFYCFTDILTGKRHTKSVEFSCFLEGRSQGCLRGKILGQLINPDIPTYANTWRMRWLFFVLFCFSNITPYGTMLADSLSYERTCRCVFGL